MVVTIIEPHEALITSIILISMLGMLANVKSLMKVKFISKKTDYSNKTLKRWYYSENQQTWVLPTGPLPKDEVSGYVYKGQEEFEAWENFNK